jgi:hypothetical protein
MRLLSIRRLFAPPLATGRTANGLNMDGNMENLIPVQLLRSREYKLAATLHALP